MSNPKNSLFWMAVYLGIVAAVGAFLFVPLSGGGELADNWELSTARALSVVEYLASQGIPQRRMAAAGFGEYRPVDEGSTADAYRRNRRIEIKRTTP